jgi:RNA polymerase sigma-70 factor (ECF subfamily)
MASPPDILDDVLVTRVQMGDLSAAERLVERYQQPLRYFLIRLLDSRERAEEVLQEVWMAVFRRIRRLRSNQAFSPWVYRIARNRAYDMIRKTRRVEPMPEELPGPSDDDEEFTAEDAAAVHECIGELATPHREVLLLRFLEEMSYEQIANVTSCSVGTVKSRLHHAKLLLRQKMERYYAKR